MSIMLTERQQLAALLKLTDTTVKPIKQSKYMNDSDSDESNDKENTAAVNINNNNTIRISNKVNITKINKLNLNKPRSIHIPAQYSTWSIDQQNRWQSIALQPDIYYYYYTPPGINELCAPYSKEEINTFKNMLLLRPPMSSSGLTLSDVLINNNKKRKQSNNNNNTIQWGLFSLNMCNSIYTRPGYQCEALYNHLYNNQPLIDFTQHSLILNPPNVKPIKSGTMIHPILQSKKDKSISENNTKRVIPPVKPSKSPDVPPVLSDPQYCQWPNIGITGDSVLNAVVQPVSPVNMLKSIMHDTPSTNGKYTSAVGATTICHSELYDTDDTSSIQLSCSIATQQCNMAYDTSDTESSLDSTELVQRTPSTMAALVHPPKVKQNLNRQKQRTHSKLRLINELNEIELCDDNNECKSSVDTDVLQPYNVVPTQPFVAPPRYMPLLQPLHVQEHTTATIPHNLSNPWAIYHSMYINSNIKYKHDIQYKHNQIRMQTQLKRLKLCHSHYSDAIELQQKSDTIYERLIEQQY